MKGSPVCGDTWKFNFFYHPQWQRQSQKCKAIINRYQTPTEIIGSSLESNKEQSLEV